ncbi:glycosyltransferase family 2 protein [Flavobacterium gelidilacus]|uniref:glycosyltransferase family 2 protein n=1 Tax=Flavobacterium gelidilacus TaxID=206041 RepID=UPI0004131F67|nr:glycosyltransferase family 2 protein [Flavobacterium gelidilacus]
MKTITIFTPTYNRAYLLPRLYKSLRDQTNNDFLWLIIDDGSSDNTKELVAEWILENKIDIQYQYKENGGMHTGHNTAFMLINTEYSVCVDSDDFLLLDSIEKFISLIKKHKISEDKTLAGFIGLNITINGNVIGNKFPKDIMRSTYQNISYKHNAVGDKKIVFKSVNVKKLKPYPVFNTEKFVPLYFPIILDSEYEYLCFNTDFCIVEYQDDGSTINIFKQYIKNPQGFRFSRRIEMIHFKNFKNKLKSAIHLVSSNIILKEINLLKGSPNILLTILAIPFGIVWYFKIKLMVNSKRDISNYIK